MQRNALTSLIVGLTRPDPTLTVSCDGACSARFDETRDVSQSGRRKAMRLAPRVMAPRISVGSRAVKRPRNHAISRLARRWRFARRSAWVRGLEARPAALCPGQPHRVDRAASTVVGRYSPCLLAETSASVKRDPGYKLHGATVTLDPCSRCVTVIGAGLDGAACVGGLRGAAAQVTWPEKVRSAGGRMAPRRAGWVDASSAKRSVTCDHGTQCFVPVRLRFKAAMARTMAANCVNEWPATESPFLNYQISRWSVSPVLGEVDPSTGA